MLCLCQSGCVLWISGGPTGKECIRFQPHDGNTILRYAYGSENEIARRHGVVHKDFQCRKRTGLLGIDGLNAGRIPSSAMERHGALPLYHCWQGIDWSGVGKLPGSQHAVL